MVQRIITLLEEGYTPKSILGHLDECGNDEFDFFEAFLDFYSVVGRKANSISSYELKNGNSTLWNEKLRKMSTSDTNDVYSNWLPSNENHDLEHVAAFNSLMALGSFIKSRRPRLCAKLTEKFSSSEIALGEGNNNDCGSLIDSIQPLVSVSEELFESRNWILTPQENCTTFIGDCNTVNVYRIELGCLMGRNEKFKEVVEVLSTLAQRFVEYVETTNVGVEVFKLLLDQASETDKTGTAELFLSVMLTTRFDTRYSRHQCDKKHHAKSHFSGGETRLYDLGCLEGLRRVYFGKVIDAKLLSDYEKKKFSFETLQSLDFLHQMICFKDKDAVKLSLQFVHLWIYSGSPVAIAQSAKMLRTIFEAEKGILNDGFTIEEIHKLSSWIFLIISHNKGNTEILSNRDEFPDSIPLLTEEEVRECIELYKYINLKFQSNVDPQNLKLLTSVACDPEVFKCIVQIITNRYKADLKGFRSFKDFLKFSVNFCCEKNRIIFLNLLTAETNENIIKMLVSFFDKTFYTLLEDNHDQLNSTCILVSIEYLESTIEQLSNLKVKFNDDVYLSVLKKFNFLEIFDTIFNSFSDFYSIVNPSLKLLLTVLKLNIPWFVNKENVLKLQEHLENIFIVTKDRITISYLSKIFMFLYYWTRDTFGCHSMEFNDTVKFICSKLTKHCFEILIKNHEMLEVDFKQLTPEELFFYSLNQDHIFAAIKIDALPKIGSDHPKKIFDILVQLMDHLIKLRDPLAAKVISEIMKILPKYALHVILMKNNIDDMDDFLHVLQFLEQLSSIPTMSVCKAITSYFYCISKLCIRQTTKEARNKIIKTLVKGKILDKINNILVNEIFGDTPFYFDWKSSNIQGLYINAPKKDKLGEGNEQSVEVAPFIRNLLAVDENENIEIGKKRLQVYQKRFKYPIKEHFKLKNEEYSKFYFQHVALRICKIATLSSHLMEEWEEKKELLSSVKTLFFLVHDKEIKTIIKRSIEWIYAFTLLCPWEKYEDLLVEIKGCLLFSENDSDEKFDIFDRISLKIFSILDVNKTLDENMKCEFAVNALSRLASRK
uniref:DUF4704 domain-containing protein n=1 Tax=Strongyloides venezuelensis TaxID=75913 RepID=A0A0K0F808_STRVS